MIGPSLVLRATSVNAIRDNDCVELVKISLIHEYILYICKIPALINERIVTQKSEPYTIDTVVAISISFECLNFNIKIFQNERNKHCTTLVISFTSSRMLLNWYSIVGPSGFRFRLEASNRRVLLYPMKSRPRWFHSS